MVKRTFEKLFPTPSFLVMPSFGLDISDESIKYVSFKRRHGMLHVDQYGLERIPEGVVAAGRVQQPKKLIPALTTLKKKLKTDFVRVSLPEEQVYSFQLRVPILPRDEVRETILLQLEEQVPLSVDDVLFDYDLVLEETNGYVIQVSVIPKDIVDDYVALLQAADLVPLSFELEGQAIARAAITEHETDGVMVVDFGATRTSINITKGQTVLFTSTVDIGGVSLTKLIQDHKKISFEEAEELKRAFGLVRSTESGEIFDILLNELSVLRDEINRHFVYWHTRKSDPNQIRSTIQEIVLCGGEANLKGLVDYLSRSLRKKIRLANPWVNIVDLETHIPEISRGESLSYITALGLAMRGYWYD